MNIEKLANSYNELHWTNYSKCFKCVLEKEEKIGIIPHDILVVLVGLFGIEEATIWVEKKIKLLDNNSVVELMNSDIGIKAVKMFLLSMPN